MERHLKIQEDIERLQLETQRIQNENNYCWLILGGVFLVFLIISLI